MKKKAILVTVIILAAAVAAVFAVYHIRNKASKDTTGTESSATESLSDELYTDSDARQAQPGEPAVSQTDTVDESVTDTIERSEQELAAESESVDDPPVSVPETGDPDSPGSGTFKGENETEEVPFFG